MNPFKISLIVLISLYSCANSNNKIEKKKDAKISKQINKVTNTKKDSSFISLPIGNKLLLNSFPQTISFADKKLNPLLDSLSKSFDKINQNKTSNCFKSKKKIEYRYFEPKKLLEDSIAINYERIFKLPNKNGYNIYIEKKSNKCNKIVNSDINYITLYNKDRSIAKRYVLGYMLFGDLSESTKHWYIDKNYIIHTRVISNVSGNEETYVNDLQKYTITEMGNLVDYFDNPDGKYISAIEEGVLKNHLKDGKWIEKKPNYGYVNNETYAVL